MTRLAAIQPDDQAAEAAITALLESADVAPTRLGDTVVEKLSRAILEGRLKPGDALPSEARIAAAFSISKQVAREAIRELAGMGVVRIHQGKVTRVRDLGAEPLGRFFRFAVRGSGEGLVEAVELRRILEPPIAGLAARRRSAEALGRIDAALTRLEAAMQDIPLWMEADLDFHESLADAAGNRLLRLQLHGLRPLIHEIMVMFNARRPRERREWRETFARHETVARAVRAGDAAEAERAMAAHFSAADDAIREIFPGTS